MEYQSINSPLELFQALAAGHEVHYSEINSDIWVVLHPEHFSVHELLNFKVKGYWNEMTQAEFRMELKP